MKMGKQGSAAIDLGRSRMRFCGLLFVACFSVAGTAVSLIAQEVAFRSSVRGTDTDTEEPRQVELTHGMPRLWVFQLLGDPPMESRIGVLGRSRVKLTDGTELLFERDSLVGVNAVQPTEVTDDGRLSIVVNRTTVIYDEELVLSKPHNLPVGDERSFVKENFYFAEGLHGQDGFDIHFTPMKRVCLLNDCPGCDLCTGSDCQGGNRCCNDLNCQGHCGTALDNSTWNIFRISVDALFLSRLGDDFTKTLLNDGDHVQTEDLTHGMTSGVRSSLTLHLYDGQHLEFGCLGSFHWSADGRSTNLDPPAVPAMEWNGTYDAKLDDYQLNYIYRKWDRNWSVLCGFRYSEHEDSFTSAFPNHINPALSGRAENHLIGIQVGTAAEWNCGPFLLFAGMKGGVFNNETRQTGPQFDSAIDTSMVPIAVSRFTRAGEEISFMGDFEFTALYPIVDGLLVRVGYQGLVFSDMVQVRKQSGTAASGSPLNYHGIFTGIELRY